MKKKEYLLNHMPILAVLFLLFALFGCSNFQSVGIVAPDAPSGLVVGNPTLNSLSISWNSSTGATNYQLSRSPDNPNGPWTQVYSNSGINYTDTGLLSGAIYYYTVKATNSAGSSPSSGAVQGITLAVAPLAPTGLSITGTTSFSVSLAWNASSGATSYQLYRNGTQVYSGSYTYYIDTVLASGSTYYYAVRASNGSGSSALSTAVQGTTTILVTPSAPTGLTVGSATSSSLYISWNASSGATFYQLFRGSTQVYNGPGTTYTDTGLAPSTTYYYTVQAMNGAGTSALSAAVPGTTTILVAPSAPTGLTVGSATSSSLYISWNASSGATSYQLFRGSTQVYNGPGTTYTDTGLAPSTTYYYTVQAMNGAGTSAPSSPVTGTTQTTTSTLYVHNDTLFYYVYYVYIRVSGTSTWGSDLLGGNAIAPGTTYTFTGIAAGTYDLYAVDPVDGLTWGPILTIVLPAGGSYTWNL